MQHKPGSWLGHFYVAMQFHARNAFRIGEAKVDGYAPFLHRHFGIGDWCICFNAEITAAASAPVRHFFMFGWAGVSRTAMLAISTIRPYYAFNPFSSHFIVWKHSEQIDKRYVNSVRLAWCFILHNKLTSLRIYQLS